MNFVGKKVEKNIVVNIILKSDKKQQIIIRKNKKLGKFWHPKTKFVLKSKEEKIIVGKVINDTEIVKLNKKDIEECKKWKFRFEKKKEEKKIEEEKDKKKIEEKKRKRKLRNVKKIKRKLRKKKIKRKLRKKKIKRKLREKKIKRKLRKK